MTPSTWGPGPHPQPIVVAVVIVRQIARANEKHASTHPCKERSNRLILIALVSRHRLHRRRAQPALLSGRIQWRTELTSTSMMVSRGDARTSFDS